MTPHYGGVNPASLKGLVPQTEAEGGGIAG